MPNSKKVEIARTVALAFMENFHDPDVQFSVVAEDCTFWSLGDNLPGQGEQLRTKGYQLAHVKQVLHFFAEPPKMTVKELVVAPNGDVVALEAEMNAKFVGGVENRRVYSFFLKVRDGKIVRVREYQDTEATKRAVQDLIASGAITIDQDNLLHVAKNPKKEKGSS